MARPPQRVIVAKTRIGVRRLAEDNGWIIEGEITSFSEIDTLDDGTLGPDIGRLFTNREGWVALARSGSAAED